MKAITTRSVALFVASMTMSATLPLAASQSWTGLSIGDSMVAPDGTTVRLHMAYSTKDRVDLGKALEVYNLLLQQGKTGLTKPDINSRASIDFYLTYSDGPVRPTMAPVDNPLSTKDYVPPVKDVSPVDSLSQQERAALLRSEKTGVCWRYPGFSTDYMTVCQKFIQGRTVLRTTGLQNDLVNSRTTGRQYLLRGGSRSSMVSAPLTVKGYDYMTTSSRSGRLRGGASSK